MSDQIEELFADLRATELPAVRPPGTGPLRRAARRRRAVLSGAAGAAVLAVVGLVAFVHPGGFTTPVATPASAGPGYDGATLEREVFKVITPQPTVPGKRTLAGTVTGHGPQEDRHTLLGGSYYMRMTCFGTGSMEVTVAVAEVGQAPSATTLTVACDRPGRLQRVPLTVPDPSGDLTVRVLPDVAGPGQAAFGYALVLAPADELRWQDRARTALTPSANRTSTRTFFLDMRSTDEDMTADRGRGRLRAVCIGFGTATLEVGPAEEPKKATVRCALTDPPVSTVLVASLADLNPRFEPDRDSVGRAAAAIAVERY